MEGWRAEDEPRFGFVFIRKDGHRRLLILTLKIPSIPRHNHSRRFSLHNPVNRLRAPCRHPGPTYSNGMDAPAFYGINCAKVEMSSYHLIQQERPR